MPSQPKILKQTLLCKTQLFKVEGLEIEFSNGERRDYERLLGAKAAVIIVAVTANNEFLLVREYGAGLERYELGLPKGKVDPGESAEQAANRELQEEAGFCAKELIALKCLSQSPSYMQHRTQIILARDLSPSRLEGDEPEPMEVVAVPVDALSTWVLNEEISEARTIAALYLARDYLSGVTA